MCVCVFITTGQALVYPVRKRKRIIRQLYSVSFGFQEVFTLAGFPESIRFQTTSMILCSINNPQHLLFDKKESWVST